MKTLLKIMIAAIIGLNAGVVAVALNATDNVVFAATITVDMVVALVIGVFDIPDETKKTAMRKHIKRHDSTNDMQEAA